MMSIKSALLIQKLLTPIYGVLVKMLPSVFFPTPTRKPPGGAYNVGVRDIQFEKLRSPDSIIHKKRKLMARIWYPTDDIQGRLRRPVYKDDELPVMIDGLKRAQGLSDIFTKQIGASLTWSYENAKLKTCESHSLPVILFSHGLGLMLDSNIQLCEYFASRGYIVISVAHPSASAAVRFPDGSVHCMEQSTLNDLYNKEMFEAVQAILTATSLEKREQATAIWSEKVAQNGLQFTWVEDCQDCIDSILENRCNLDVSDITHAGDFEHIGAIGMSFGGSVSASLGQQDKRVSAVINLDGGQAGLELMNCDIRIPLLALHSNDIPLAMKGSFNDFHYESYINAGVASHVYRAIIDGSAHNDFTDYALFKGRLLRLLIMLGKVDGERVLDIINETCLAFFDSHLKHQKTDTLASKFNLLAQRWPELNWLKTDKVRALARKSEQLRKPDNTLNISSREAL